MLAIWTQGNQGNQRWQALLPRWEQLCQIGHPTETNRLYQVAPSPSQHPVESMPFVHYTQLTPEFPPLIQPVPLECGVRIGFPYLLGWVYILSIVLHGVYVSFLVHFWTNIVAITGLPLLTRKSPRSNDVQTPTKSEDKKKKRYWHRSRAFLLLLGFCVWFFRFLWKPCILLCLKPFHSAFFFVYPEQPFIECLKIVYISYQMNCNHCTLHFESHVHFCLLIVVRSTLMLWL
jgi:hypothetical protein